MEEKTHKVLRETGLTPDLIDRYIAAREGDLTKSSVAVYKKVLRMFYDGLPKDKVLHQDCLADFKEQLKNRGYRETTIKSWVTIINWFFEYLNRQDLLLIERGKRPAYTPPALTWDEYLRLLSAAKILGTRQGYLLVKLYAAVPLPRENIKAVTVEAVRSGVLTYTDKEKTHLVCIPEQLRRDLLDYAREMGYSGGYIFRTRSGRPLARERILQIIHRLCDVARVDTEKGNVSCLRRLYQATCDEFKAQINMEAIIMQMQERLMEREEKLVGWE